MIVWSKRVYESEYSTEYTERLIEENKALRAEVARLSRNHLLVRRTRDGKEESRR
jgi:hypothetical protein